MKGPSIDVTYPSKKKKKNTKSKKMIKKSDDLNYITFDRRGSKLRGKTFGDNDLQTNIAGSSCLQASCNNRIFPASISKYTLINQ